MCVTTASALCTGAQRSRPPSRPRALETQPRPGCLSHGWRGPGVGRTQARHLRRRWRSAGGWGEKAWEAFASFGAESGGLRQEGRARSLLRPRVPPCAPHPPRARVPPCATAAQPAATGAAATSSSPLLPSPLTPPVLPAQQSAWPRPFRQVAARAAGSTRRDPLVGHQRTVCQALLGVLGMRPRGPPAPTVGTVDRTPWRKG